MLSHSENNSEFDSKSIDLLVSMRLISNAFKSVSKQVIINCFRKATFDFDKTNESDFISNDSDTDIEDFWSHLKESK